MWGLGFRVQGVVGEGQCSGCGGSGSRVYVLGCRELGWSSLWGIVGHAHATFCGEGAFRVVGFACAPAGLASGPVVHSGFRV